MTRWRLHGALLAIALVCLWLGACEQCGKDEQKPSIATLSTLVGAGVSRDFAAQPHAWTEATLGAQLALGDGARTDANSTAELTFVNGAVLALKSNTTVRLLVDRGQDETGIDVQAGQARLRSSGRGLTLRTHLGLATIAPDSEITLTREGEQLGLHVALGTLSFRDLEAGVIGLEAGDDVRIGIGMAVFGLSRTTKEAAPGSGEIMVEMQAGEGRATSGDKARTLTKGSHSVSAGTQLRLPADGEAIVVRGRQRVRLRGAGDFVLGVGEVLAESRRGRVSFEAIEADVTIRVPGGIIIARVSPEGTSGELSISAEESLLKVERGLISANINGRSEDVPGGEERRWPNGVTPIEPGPSYRNISAGAGESFIVHAPSVPVAIGFSFGKKCPDEGQLELVGGRQVSRGQGSANLAFGAGMRAYTLRCLDKSGAPGRIVARGSVQVLVDLGTRKLPPIAPTSRVEADGRTYTIYYQNQLPEVAVRWPNPPTVAAYALEVDDKSIALKAPEHLFRSGTLGDGTHRMAFSAEGRRSRTTTVEVRFDNVAPKASLSEPADRGFTPGELVTVKGVALPTWKVTLEGGTIAMSPGERFTAQVQTSKEQPDIAVRLSHPRLGTHYYLRRASGSP